MLSPYYEDSTNKVKIYCGDCAEIMPQLEKADLCLTDPPYGIGAWSATGGNSVSAEEAAAANFWDVAPDWEVLMQCIAHAKYSIVWGYNYLANQLGATRAPLVWDKGQRGMHFADGEMAWTNFDWGTMRILNYNIHEGDTKNKRLHPTQKPLNVMKWCIKQIPESRLKVASIIDPFCGSGTTLRAAIDFGIACVGIEKSEEYCAIAAERCKQQSMFAAGEQRAQPAIQKLF